MAYDDERVKISRVPVQYVKITFSECANRFGVNNGADSNCQATVLTQCYNTWPTCKDKTHYNVTEKEYKFTSNDAPLPFRTGERPYVKSVDHLPQEIKNELMVNQRITVELYDEPDNDVVLEGYAWLVTEDGKIIITEDDTAIAAEGITVTSSAISYFKKLFARHQNWYNKQIEIYDGFYVSTNLSTENFKRKFVGKVKEVSFSGNLVKIEAVDLLTNLKDIQYPVPTNDVTLKKELTAGTFKPKFKNPQNLSTGYITIGEEIMHLSTLSTVTGAGVIDSNGDFFTPATDHGKDAAVQQCVVVTPKSPFDIMTTLLTSWADIDSTSVDTAAIVGFKSWPGRECYFSQVIPQPVSLDELFEDLLRMTECHAYIDENQKIVIGRNFLKNSTAAWPELSDSANIIENSEKVSIETEDIITQGILEWDAHVGMSREQNKRWRKKHPTSTSLYEQMSIHTDTEAESTYYHGERVVDNIQTNWLHTILSYPGSDIGYASVESGYASTDPYSPANVKAYADGWIQRHTVWRSQPKKVYELDVEYKDATIAVGDQILISGNIFLDSSGNSLDKVPCFVRKKEPQDDWSQTLTLEDYGARVGLIAPDSQVDYDTSLSSEHQYGFISNTNGDMSNGNKGYVIY